jgi:hypothetical protein
MQSSSHTVSQLARLALLFIAFGAVVAACSTVVPGQSTGGSPPGVSAPLTPGVTILPTNLGQAPSNGLIAAQHAQCNFGPTLLHYLATGDNGGNPWYDQHYSSDVGASAPQARAIADKAIQDCDADLDKQATSAAQATSESAAATSKAAAAATSKAAAATSEAAAVTSEAQAAATREQARVRSCQSIGGKYDSTTYGSCQSTVQGDATGHCSYSSVGFEGGSQISQAQLVQAKKSYPGCWPG